MNTVSRQQRDARFGDVSLDVGEEVGGGGEGGGGGCLAGGDETGGGVGCDAPRGHGGEDGGGGGDGDVEAGGVEGLEG